MDKSTDKLNGKVARKCAHPISRTCRCVAIVLIVTAFACSVQQAGASILAGNVWPNADFESVAVGGDPYTARPTFWPARGGTLPSGAQYGTASGNSFPVVSGDRSLLVGENDATHYSAWTSDYLDLQAQGINTGDTVVVHWHEWYNVSGSYRLTLIWDSNGSVAGGTIGYDSFVVTGDSGGWIERTEILSVDKRYLRLQLVSGGAASATGDMVVDDLSLALHHRVALSRVDAMPDLPSPYLMRDWKQVTRDYDAFAFDFSKAGDSLPLIWWDTTRRNFDFDTFGQPSYVGHRTMTGGGAHEAINCVATVLGVSLCGVDKSNQGGTNWVAMLEQYFNLANGEDLVLNYASGDTGRTFWYDTYPAVLYCQLLWLYPDTGGMENQMKTVADRYAAASAAMGGSVSPWSVPDYDHTAFDYDTMSAYDNGRWKEPDVAAAYGWVDYMAWVKWGDTNHLIGARWAMEFLNGLPAGSDDNPLFEVLLPFGAYLSARMNAEVGTAYDTGKLLDWVFGPSANSSARNGWGVICDDPWGGYDCDGLVGSVVDGGGYAFAMNTFDTVGALVPLVRYDDSYAPQIAKWVLNAANASRLFYSGYLPASNQTGYAWASTYDPDSCLTYEGLRKQWNGVSPRSMGGALVGDWASTDFALYGASHVGIMAACIETSNVPGILQIDCLATDYYHAPAYPTYLYFNPHAEAKTVQIDVGPDAVDLYDGLSGSFVERDASGHAAFDLAPKMTAMLVLLPAGAPIGESDGKLLADGVVIDYRDGDVDTDADGLPDWWESLHFEGTTNALPGAIAANGASNLENYQLGFDPADSNAVFRIRLSQPTADGRVEVNWPSVGGKTYAVEYADALSATGFVQAATTTETNVPVGAPWTNRFSDPGPSSSNRFFRVKLLVPFHQGK